MKNRKKTPREDLFTRARVNNAIRMAGIGRRQEGAAELARHDVPIDIALRTLAKPKKKSRTRKP